MNLVMAVFWGMVALGAFLVAWVEPDLRFLRVGGTGLNIGWLALVFGAYNVARWLSARALAQRKQMLAEISERRYRPRRGAAPESEPNPAFDFRDRPPEEGDPAAALTAGGGKNARTAPIFDLQSDLQTETLG